MGGGGSKPAEPAKTDSSPAKKPRDNAHSAPPAPAAGKHGSFARRGSMAPANNKRHDSQAASLKLNKQAGTMLNSTHSAMRRGSTVARTRLTRDKVRNAARDEFEDTDEEPDVFSRADAVPEPKKDDDEPAAAKFGRKAAPANTDEFALGNAAAGDMSQAVARGLGGNTGRHANNAAAAAKGTTVTGRRQRAFFANDDDLEDEPEKASSALAGAKKKAQRIGVEQELQRRQTAREGVFNGTLNQTKSFGGTLASQSNDAPMVNGTMKLKTLLDQMRQFRYNMRSKRDMSDNDITDMQRQQQQYANVKQFIAKEVQSLGRRVDILARDVKDQAIEFVQSIIEETDTRAGNLEVLQAFLRHLVTVPWTEECLEREWVQTAVRDGSYKYFEVLIQLPMINDMDIALDAVAILEAIVDHKKERMNLAVVYIKHWSTFDVPAHKDEMAPLWQRLLADISSAKRAIPNEDRTPRMPLIQKILSLSHLLRFDLHQVDEESDGLSILTRSVREGDAQLLSCFVSNATDVDWNHVYPDGTTLLSHCVSANSKLATETVLSARGIDALTAIPAARGHALDLARKTPNCHPGIISALEQKMRMAAPSGSDAPEEQTASANYARKKRMAAAAKLQPELPEHIKNPPKQLEWQSTPDWEIDTEERPIVATDEVMGILAQLQKHRIALADAKKQLLQSEAAEGRYFELEEAMPALKGNVADQIMALGKRISVEGKQQKETIAAMVDELLEEQEAENNCRLVRVLLYRIITVDFAPLITSRKWALKAVQAGLLEVFDSLMRVHKLWAEEDVVELFEAAVAHPTKRIPLCNNLLRHEDNLRLSTHAPHLRRMFQELFDAVCDRSAAKPGEDRADRRDLLYRLCSRPYINLQFEHEFSGSQTIFSRACREGDMDVVKVLVDLRMLRDVNRVHSNKSTALMQAVVGNQVEVVKFLAADPSVDPTIRSPHGTAMELAQKMRKDQAIIRALRDAGG